MASGVALALDPYALLAALVPALVLLLLWVAGLLSPRAGGEP